MKIFVSVLVLASVVLAEPPRYRIARFRFEKRELGETGKQVGGNVEEAPYAPAGFVPSREFKIPSRQEVAPPETSYGIPDDSYSAPISYTHPELEYGVPRQARRELGEEEANESEDVTTEKSEDEENKGETEELKTEVENKEVKDNDDKKENLEVPENQNVENVVSTQGVYYVLLPGSQLQRVQFTTENDVRNMAYTARLQYRNEDRGPLLIYSAVPQYTMQAAGSAYQYPTSAAYFQLF